MHQERGEGNLDAETIEQIYQQLRRYEKRVGTGNVFTKVDDDPIAGRLEWRLSYDTDAPRKEQRLFHALEWLIHRCVKVGERSLGMECEVLAYAADADGQSAKAVLRVGEERFQIKCAKPTEPRADIEWTFAEDFPWVGWPNEGKQPTPAQVAYTIISS